MVIFNLLVYLFINSQCHDINFDWILIRVPILICSAGNNCINVLFLSIRYPSMWILPNFFDFDFKIILLIYLQLIWQSQEKL